MVEVILWIVAAVALFVAFHSYREKNKLERIIKNKKFGCRYNDLTGCYGTCCNVCDRKKECNWCCGGNAKYCGGLVEED